MKELIKKRIARTFLFIIIFNLNSCFFLFDESYQGIATTTLAGNISINANSCFVPTDLTSDEDIALSFVFNLETVGDRYVTLCLIQDNMDYIFNYINGLAAGDPLKWILDGTGFREIKIAFYASDVAISPGDSSVGDASEVLLFGLSDTQNYQIAEFDITNLQGQTCSNHLGTNVPGLFYADLDLNVLHKKKYIVARVPLCGNFPIGTAANPLYSEKHLDE